MNDWLMRLGELAAAEGGAARVSIIAARGPTPREVGAAMLVTASRHEGKIGRGALEADAIARARLLLARADLTGNAAAWTRQLEELATGPVLGVSSGGSISVLIEVFGPAELEQLGPAQPGAVLVRPLAGGLPARLAREGAEATAGLPREVAAALAAPAGEPGLSRRLVDSAGGRWLLERLGPQTIPFYVYGTGLVARALVDKLAGLPFAVVWVDTDAARFTQPLPGHVRALPAPDPVAVARDAPAGSFHIVMTQSHELDYRVASALLADDRFGHLGMIGSRMKRKRLEAMLEADGISADARSRLICPVGLAGIKSKTPAVIALAIAAQALIALQTSADRKDQATASNA